MRSQPIFIIHNLNTFLCVYRSSLFAFALYGIMNVYCGDGRRRKTIFFSRVNLWMKFGYAAKIFSVINAWMRRGYECCSPFYICRFQFIPCNAMPCHCMYNWNCDRFLDDFVDSMAGFFFGFVLSHSHSLCPCRWCLCSHWMCMNLIDLKYTCWVSVCQLNGWQSREDNSKCNRAIGNTRHEDTLFAFWPLILIAIAPFTSIHSERQCTHTFSTCSPVHSSTVFFCRVSVCVCCECAWGDLLSLKLNLIE